MFQTRYNPREDKATTPIGDRYQQEYEYQIVDGYEQLVPAGVTDLVEKIQESFESTKLSNIIARYNAGDLGALKKAQGVFANISEMPTTLQEAQNMRIKAETAFDSLPVDVREKYDFSAYKFYDEGGLDYLKDLIANEEKVAPSEAPKEEKVAPSKAPKVEGEVKL